MDWSGMTFRNEGVRATPRRGTGLKQGELVLWCESCQGFIRVDAEEYEGRCPECGQPMFRMKCTRCEGMWYPRDPAVMPGTCPKCKSPYWNRTRTKNQAKAKETPKVDPALSALLERKIAEAQADREREEAEAAQEAADSLVDDIGGES